MSIFNRIFNTKAVAPVNEPLPNVTVNYSRRIITTNEQDIYKIYKDSSLIQSCVNLFTNEFLSAPFKPYVQELPTDNIALDIFTIETLKDLIYQVLLSGTGFIYKIRNGAGQLVSIQVLSGFHVTKIYDQNGYIKNWQYQTGRGTFDIDAADIVPITWFSASTEDKDFGISPINAVIGAASQIIELQRFVTEMTENDFVPRTILSAPTETNLTYHQQKLIMDSVREEFQNNNGSIKVLNGGWQLSRLSLGLDELDITALRIVPETDICNAFQIPTTLIQTIAGQQNSTYNNVETARKFFLQNTIGGFWSKVEQIINSNFSYEFPQIPNWFFETSNLPSLQEDQNESFIRLNQLFQSNVISRAEFRSELDLDDIDGGSAVYYQDLLFGSTTAFVAPSEPFVALESDAKASSKKKSINYPNQSQENKQTYWETKNRLMDFSQKQFESILNNVIDDIHKRTKEVVRNGGNFIGDGNIKNEDLRVYNEELLTTQKAFRKQIGRELRIDTEDLSDNSFRKLRIDGLRTQNELVKSLNKMLIKTDKVLQKNADKSLDDKLIIVDRQIQTYRNTHAKTISNYSSSNLMTSTQKVVFDDKKIKYSWLSQRDGDVRDAHVIADGQLADSAGMFTVGGERTDRPCGSGLSSANSVNCRCILFPQASS